MNAKQFDSISFVPVNRKFFQHPFWREERTFSKAEAWLDLVQAARFEDSTATELIGGQLVSWTRGQLPGSLRYLGDRWDWDKNKVDRFLQFLEKQKMITRHICNGQTIIELTNFATYNTKGQKTGQGKGQQTPSTSNSSTDEQDTKRDTQRDTGGTPTGQARDKTNKENKGNTEEEKKVEGSADAPPATPEKILLKNPFSEDFLSEWARWKKYKKSQHRSSYKSVDTEQTAINDLYSISDGDEEVARRIINKSIARCWQGLFKLKKEDYEGLQPNSSEQRAASSVGRHLEFDRP